LNTKPERHVYIRPAYDCLRVQPCVHGNERCSSGDPGGNHGVHNAELHMAVRGPEAEIILVVSTGWDLPTVPKGRRVMDIQDYPYPRGKLVSFHTARPRYEGQYRNEPDPDAWCKNWSHCYCDSGYRMADGPVALLVEKGSDAVWEWLENQYHETLMDMAVVSKN
jgi:hypothetical protein